MLIELKPLKIKSYLKQQTLSLADQNISSVSVFIGLNIKKDVSILLVKTTKVQ